MPLLSRSSNSIRKVSRVRFRSPEDPIEPFQWSPLIQLGPSIVVIIELRALPLEQGRRLPLWKGRERQSLFHCDEP